MKDFLVILGCIIMFAAFLAIISEIDCSLLLFVFIKATAFAVAYGGYKLIIKNV